MSGGRLFSDTTALRRAPVSTPNKLLIQQVRPLWNCFLGLLSGPYLG